MFISRLLARLHATEMISLCMIYNELPPCSVLTAGPCPQGFVEAAAKLSDEQINSVDGPSRIFRIRSLRSTYYIRSHSEYNDTRSGMGLTPVQWQTTRQGAAGRFLWSAPDEWKSIPFGPRGIGGSGPGETVSCHSRIDSDCVDDGSDAWGDVGTTRNRCERILVDRLSVPSCGVFTNMYPGQRCFVSGKECGHQMHKGLEMWVRAADNTTGAAQQQPAASAAAAATCTEIGRAVGTFNPQFVVLAGISLYKFGSCHFDIENCNSMCRHRVCSPSHLAESHLSRPAVTRMASCSSCAWRALHTPRTPVRCVSAISAAS